MLFILMGVGFFCGKKKIFNQAGADQLTAFLMKVTLPCTILSSMMREYDPQLLKDAFTVMGLTFVQVFLCVAIAWLLCRVFRVPEGARGMWMLLAAFSNNGFMGFPVVNAVYGSEGLFLAAAYNMSFNILMFSVGTKLVCMDSDQRSNITLKKILFTNINLSLVIGLFLFISQIPVPEEFKTLVDYLGNITTPLSMIIVGISLVNEPIASVFKDKYTILATVARLLVMPIIVYFALSLIPFPEGSLIPKVIVVIAAMPAAAASVLQARQYNANVTLAGRGIFATSLLCIITLPMILFIL